MTEVKHGNNSIAYHFIQPKTPDTSKSQDEFQNALYSSDPQFDNTSERMLTPAMPAAEIVVDPIETPTAPIANAFPAGYYSTPSPIPPRPSGQGLDIRV